MSRQSLVKARSFYVAKEYFCVAIEFGQDQEFLCRDKIFLGRDRVGQGDENLCHDIVFLCRDGVGQDQEFLCYVAKELAKVMRIYVTIEYICVATEFGLERGF